MDKKLKENIIVGIKIVGMLFFLIVLITTLVLPGGVDTLANLFQKLHNLRFTIGSPKHI